MVLLPMLGITWMIMLYNKPVRAASIRYHSVKPNQLKLIHELAFLMYVVTLYHYLNPFPLTNEDSNSLRIKGLTLIKFESSLGILKLQ